MKTEDRILEMVKEKPLLMGELQEKLQLASVEMVGVMAFLEKHGLVELMPTANEGTMVEIMPMGLQLLNLPDLPEEELPSDQLEVLERHWGEEVEDIGRKWLLLMQLKNKISCELGRSQGTITIKQEGGNFTFTAVIPIKDGALHLQDGDISKCHHTPEEVKMEVDALFKKRRRTSE